ncbi:amidohydrolase family protein [Streptomyces sp. NBC_01320]|uniref:amidohydrolase family protein n=1 Tax=Streptomyces sp. NBC_01320 TaxID=2903824 RepID=UPI002E101FA5|nr:amidohydrolase family protein [Streptomyces sp. NBC_01320]
MSRFPLAIENKIYHTIYAQRFQLCGVVCHCVRGPDHRVQLDLRPGLLADLVVLSADPTAVPVEELLEIVVLRTWVGGRQVYSQHTSEVAPC